MKKLSITVLSLLMTLIMIFSLTGCSEEKVTLTNKTVSGLSFDVPDDFSEFAENQGTMIATNKESTASIGVSVAGDASGYPAADWTQESYIQSVLANYSDVNIIEFDANATVSGSTAVYAHYIVKDSDGSEREAYNYIIYLPENDGVPMFQSITFAFSKSVDTSLKENIDAIRNSLKIQ